ncbi:polysaccharide export protein [Rhodobacteraceae bacterium 2CG4]|uniref:Polysaccharide export protein n=1 Tax=Halovulum marinum TaxID=2662447 RepID=A0A6L5YVL1_9RHOB|nr:polysaccharide biosynthesis/export family protein [Halovulum marinum]MSU88100.1 polysaccharide export protein [Halovulum marinum]
MTPRYRRTAARAAVLACVVFVAGCNSLPRPGPSAEEIVASSKRAGGDLNVVLVDGAVAQRAYVDPRFGFSQSFLTLPELRTDAFNAGDSLSVTVWENVDNGLLVGTGQKVANLQEIQVDQRGNIFVPYAGTIRAAGATPDELRELITESLGRATPDPQVEVRRLAGDGATINLIGGVSGQGVYPIEPSTNTLAAMLARAGGVTADPELAIVTVRRRSGSGRIYLQDLYENPANDIALRAGDTIIVEEDQRAFTALGATGAQARVPFPRADISAIDALAEVGGLNGNLSDPTGVFVFRREMASVANRVTGRNDMAEGEPFAYVIDLTSPGGIFIAKDFQIRDDDTIYITEAPFVAWTRVLEATSQTLNFAATLTRLGDRALE